MKKLLLGTALLFTAFCARSQNGLEGILVEKYYVSTAADSAGNHGALPVGSVTYRIYADMLPGYKFQALYGVTGHELRIESTTAFFNNSDRGAVDANHVTHIKDNSVMLDSWFSVGGAGVNGTTNYMGIMKSEDTDGSIGNNNGVLQNNNAYAGTPINGAGAEDGLVTGSPEQVTFVGLDNGSGNHALDLFNATSQSGSVFSTFNGSIASLNGSVGPTSSNKVLVGQFTTRGTFSFKLNIQIGTPTGGTQNFVAQNPVGSEISIPSLIYSNTTCVSPVAPTSVTGNTSATCINQNGAFTVAPTSGYTYNWAVAPTTVSILNGQGTDSINTSYSPTFTAGTLSVSTTNSFCGTSSTYTVALTKANPIKPNTPGTITPSIANIVPVMGTATNVSYSIASVVNADTYQWTVPAGVTIVSGQGTTTLTVNYTCSYASGNIGVKAVSLCGTLLSSAKTITPTKTKPLAPGTVSTSLVNVCSVMGTSNNVTYSISPVAVATSYTWTVPSGATIVSGQGTTSIDVNYNTSFTSGNITVTSVAGGCSANNSSAKVLAIAVPKPPVTPIDVLGPRNICANAVTGADYSVPPQPVATSWNWTVPNGLTILSGQNTTSIHVGIDTTVFTSGTIAVSAVSGCILAGTAPKNYTVSVAPSAPTPISGYTLICGGTTTGLSVPAVPNAHSYLWTTASTAIPISSGQGTTSITIPWGAKAGKVCVQANGCGTTSAQSCVTTKMAKCRLMSNGQWVAEGDEDAALNVYPSPVASGNNVTVNLNGVYMNNGDKAVVLMYDMFGRQIYSNQVAFEDGVDGITDRIPTSGISSGIYTVAVRAGDSLYKQQIIVTR